MSVAATYVDADTFTVVGDQTALFVFGRRIRCDCGVDGYKYGMVLTTSVSTDTTVNMGSDDDDITANLTAVDLSVVKPGLEGNMGKIIGPVDLDALDGYDDDAILIGRRAGNSASCNSSIFIGEDAGKNSGNTSNVVIGNSSGYFDGNSYGNIAIGYTSGPREGGGTWQNNVFMGVSCGTYSTISTSSVTIGYLACRRPQEYGVAIGYKAMEVGAGTRSYCVAVGSESAALATTTNENVSIGYRAAYTATTGEDNTCLGAHSGYSNQTGARNVCIGYKAGYNNTDSDKLHIGNNSTQDLIEGDFSAKTIKFNTDSTSSDAFDVTSGMQFDGDLSPDGGVSTGYTGDLNDSTSTKIATVVNGIITAVDF